MLFRSNPWAGVDYTNQNKQQSFTDFELGCRYYLGESAIPHGGFGLFTTISIEKGMETQSMPDICIYVADTPLNGTAFRTHSWNNRKWFGQFEGKNPRAVRVLPP